MLLKVTGLVSHAAVMDSVDDEDVVEWENNEWHYYYASVNYTAPDGRTGQADIGGIDAGSHWHTEQSPLSEEEQVFAVAISYYAIHEEAKKNAGQQA